MECAIAWLVAEGNRRVPYRGAIKNDTRLHNRAAALNLRRLIDLGLTRINGTLKSRQSAVSDTSTAVSVTVPSSATDQPGL